MGRVMRRCDLCSTTVPANAWIQHERGKRHTSFRFHGRGDMAVRHITLRNPDGSVEKSVRPHAVPERVVATARSAQDLIGRELFAHSGHALLSSAQAFLSIEEVCAVLLRLDEGGTLRTARPVVCLAEADAAAAAAAAAILSRSAGEGRNELQELSLSVQSSRASIYGGAAGEAALSAALACVGHALAVQRAGGLRVALRLGGALQQRRCVNLLVKSLERALRRSTGLVELHITTAAGTMREEDVTRLVTAAALGWRERQRTVLLGTHADCDSSLRRLPNAIVRQILEYAEGVGRANVVVRAEASAAPPHPPAPPHPAGGGHDLNFVAMLI